MAAFNKFNVFSRDLSQGKHQFGTHVFKVMLTNVAPVATNAVKTDITEIAAGNGYTAGGNDAALTTSLSTATTTVAGTDITITASGGAIATFRYAVLYNDTQTTPVKPLVGWWDYGSALTLATGESVKVDLGSDGTSTNPVLTVV